MITGGGGFVGSHLCDEFLKDNHRIIIVTKKETDLKNISHVSKHLQIKRADITDYPKIGKIIDQVKPDVIIHLAGQTSHSKSFENPLYDVEANSKSTLFMLEKIRLLKLKCRFILGSTFIVIGRPNKIPVDEQTPCNPTTLYGINRLASEYYCKTYHQLYGIDTVVFRITNSFGPREQIIPNKNAVNYLIYKAYKDKEITLYKKGKFYRDLIYISDVISAIKIIMNKGKSGDLYWISSGTKTWFYQFGSWLHEITKTKVKYVKTPTYTKKVDVGNFVVNNAKLRSLGWTNKTAIKQGIQKTISYFESLES